MLYVERSALQSHLAQNLIKRNIHFELVDSCQEVPDTKKDMVLKSHIENFCRACPATSHYRCCNYWTADVMEGCPFDCAYCVLQAYLPHKNIQVNADSERFITSLNELIKSGEKRRIGTGELSDSLALDELFPFSQIIAPLINAQDILQFEFKTKSDRIGHLLNLNPKNVIVSWSLNPPEIAERWELGAANPLKRIAAAKKCADAGYKVAFHFDPVIYYNGWELGYASLLKTLFDNIKGSSVEYVSISAFRAASRLLAGIRLRQAAPTFLNEDIILGLDRKYRYFRGIRLKLLGFIYKTIKKEWENVFLYFCMEHSSFWERFAGFDPISRVGLEERFPHYNAF
ncbi:MAG: DNA photolyase [Deferribacteraceae bacterium]|jgi:spore photoproduct lyase|nr:DNA photolyase [Deferribacteraceae bacterium]